MAYVYRHIRLDKNVPFYIGIGNDKAYSRANDKKGRNAHWINIVRKSNYEVDIILDNISWERACEKEIEFIRLYKRHKDGGTLCNITLGGDGKLGVKHTNAYKKGHIPFTKGTKRSEYVIQKIREANLGRPSWNKGGSMKKEWIAKQMKSKIERGTLYSGEKHPMYGKKTSIETREMMSRTRKGRVPWNKGKKTGIVPKTKADPNVIKIIQYDLMGTYIMGYPSFGEAALISGVGKGNIWHCTKGNREYAGGYKWEIVK